MRRASVVDQINFAAKENEIMFVETRRYLRRLIDLNLTDDAETTGVVDFRDAAGGLVVVPDDSTITQLTYLAAVAPGQSPRPLYDAAGAEVEQAVEAGRAYPLPEACFGAGLLAILADDAGAVSLALKS